MWKRYGDVARQHLADLPGRSIEIRYEDVVDHPEQVGADLATSLDIPEFSTRLGESFRTTTVSSARGRWRRELSDEQLAQIDGAAGPLLARLGYGD